MALEIEHMTVNANDASFHVACAGKGFPLLLLHGWPEYWATWTPIMERLGLGRWSEPFLDAGHFPHHEQADRAPTEIASFFHRLAAST